MRKRYLLTALLIGLTTLCVQAQNLVPRRTSARQAARVVTSDRFVRTDLPAKTAGQAIQHSYRHPWPTGAALFTLLPFYFFYLL